MVCLQVIPVNPGLHSHLKLNGRNLVQIPRFAHGFGMHRSRGIFLRQRGLYVPEGQSQLNVVPFTLHVPPFYQLFNYLIKLISR